MQNGKVLTFALDSKELKKHFKRPITGTREVRWLLNTLGFKHVRGSVFVHDKPISTDQMYQLLGWMMETFPWIDECVKDIKVGNIGRDERGALDKIRSLMQAEAMEKEAPVNARATEQTAQPQTQDGYSKALADMVQNAPREQTRQTSAVRVSQSENVND